MGLLGRLPALILRHPVLSVFVLGLLVRLPVVAYIALQHDGFLFGDDQQYVLIAGAKATGETETWDEYTRFVYDSNLTLTLPMTLLFRVFGVHGVLGQLQVAMFGALAAALVARLALELRSRKAALVAGTFVAVLPSQVLFSSLTLKDALVWAALAALAALAAVTKRTRDLRRFALLSAGTLVVFLLLAGLRQHTLVVAAWAVFLTAWIGDARLRLARVATAAAFAVGVPFAVGAGLAGHGLLSQVNALETQRALGAQGAETAVVEPALVTPVAVSPERLATLHESAADAAARAQAAQQGLQEAQQDAAAADPDAEEVRARIAALETQARQAQQEALRLAAESEQLQREAERAAAAVPPPAPKAGLEGLFGEGGTLDPQRNLAYLPRGLSVMILQPYPWTSSDNVRLQLARAETVLWYPMLLLAIIGLVGLRRRASVLAFPLVVGGGIALMWALVEGNFGTAYRHRGEFVWAVAVLAAGGLTVLADRRRRVLGRGPSSRRRSEQGDDLATGEQSRLEAAEAGNLR